jgi:Cd2+/Zn2+-exporting ATPase
VLLCGYSEETKEGTVIYLKKDEEILGNLVIKDEIKKEAKEVISKLNKLGIKLEMFTGDNKEVATKVAAEIGITDFKYGMLPTDKYKEVENIIKNNSKGRVCFIGDGINDSPVLAISDIGISMGGVGTDAAIEASDIVIMTDNLNKIIEGINISKETGKIIKQNLIFAIGTKVLVLLLSMFGIARNVAGDICRCWSNFNYHTKYIKNIKNKKSSLITAFFFLYNYILVF